MNKNITVNIKLHWHNNIEKCYIMINDQKHKALEIEHALFNFVKEQLTDSEKQELIDNYPESSKMFKTPQYDFPWTTHNLVDQLIKSNKPGL